MVKDIENKNKKKQKKRVLCKRNKRRTMTPPASVDLYVRKTEKDAVLKMYIL